MTRPMDSALLETVQGGNEPVGGCRWASDGLQEGVTVDPGQQQALVVVEYPAGTFIGEITRRQSADSHGLLDELLGAGGDA